MQHIKLTPEEEKILGITPRVLAVPTGAPALPVSSNPTFVPPAWYPVLNYCLTSGTERGCMLFGPRGSGKSTAIRQLAKDSGANIITMVCASGMGVEDLKGYVGIVNGATVYFDGPLTRAVRDGAWLIAEEANVINPGVWSTVNTLTDKTGDPLLLPTGEEVKPTPEFRLVLLFNEGSRYAGTRDVNEALKRRLTPIYCTYPPRDSEERIVQSLTGASPSDVARCLDVASMIRAADLQFDLSPDIVAKWIRFTLSGLGSWRDTYRIVICDLVGAPELTVPQRAVLDEIAMSCGVPSW